MVVFESMWIQRPPWYTALYVCYQFSSLNIAVLLTLFTAFHMGEEQFIKPVTFCNWSHEVLVGFAEEWQSELCFQSRIWSSHRAFLFFTSL
jgi:hypothetical protein